MLAKYIRAQLALAGLSFVFYRASMLVLRFPDAIALGVLGRFVLAHSLIPHKQSNHTPHYF
jgi:predicted PurR-regulated permease PerM